MMDRYWTTYLAITFAAFAIPEFAALGTGHARNTLSWWVWRHTQVIVHQPISQWTATHFLFAGIFVVVALWLVGHLTLGIWR